MVSSFFNIFKKPTHHDLDAYLQNMTPDFFEWMALSINQRTIEESIMTKELFLIAKDGDQLSWQAAEKDEDYIHRVFKSKRELLKGKITDPKEQDLLKSKFNTLINRAIEQNLTTFREGFSRGNFSVRQMEAEDKAVEWLRVSFEVLKKGIIESLTNPEYLFQSTLFAGINPKTGKHEMRLICFNLDMTFILLDDNDLRVIIYNKGAAENFDGLKPSLVGDYSARKREILDHFTSLLGVLSKGLHL